ATTFFQLTNIQVNPDKSILAAITKISQPEIQFNNTVIKAIDMKASFRFLGCWYTANKRHTSNQKIIKEEVTNSLKRLQRTQITDKQAIYIVNTVILTRIAYQIQNTTLSSTVCKQITNKYTNIVKHKAGLASSIPNSTIHHYRIYGLRTIEDIQTQQHISIINQMLNHPLFSKSSFKIRLQQLQNSAATNKSILSLYPKIFPNTEVNTTTAIMLNTCQLNNIVFNN